MISTLIHLLIVILICGVIYWAVTAILALIPLPAPFAQIANIILILILCLILINALLPLAGGAPFWRYG